MKTRIYAVSGPGLSDKAHELVRAASPSQVRRFLLSQYDIHVAEQDEIIEALQAELPILDATAVVDQEETDE